MIKKVLFIILLTSTITNAQTPDWTWAKNISLYLNTKVNLTSIDNEGNVYLIGDFNAPTATIGGEIFTNSSLSNSSDSYIIKFDTVGNVIWTKQLTGSASESLTSVTTDSAGNVYIVGGFGNTITLGSTVLSRQGGNSFIAKLNSAGDYIWATTTSSDKIFQGRDLKVDDEGNVFLIGSTNSPTLVFGNVVISGNSTEAAGSNVRIFVTKFDSSGNCLWGKMSNHSAPNAQGSKAQSIAVDNHGGVVICGVFAQNDISFDSVTLVKQTQNNLNISLFLFKFNSEGLVQWGYTSQSTANNTVAYAVAIDTERNVYVGGSFASNISIGSLQLDAQFSGTQMYLAKFNSTGAGIWAKTSGYGTDGLTSIRSIDLDSNNNVYVVGNSAANKIIFTNNVLLNNLTNSGSSFVTKYTSSGTPVWAKGILNMSINSVLTVRSKSENDLFVAGEFNKPTLQLGNISLTKSNAVWDLFIGRLNALSLNSSDNVMDAISIYPNPTSDVLHIANLQKPHSYRLYNILGKLVKQGNLVNEMEILNTSDLQSGMYIMNLIDRSGNISQQKIVKQ